MTKAKRCQGLILDWFEHYGRHDLPWQHPRTPYRVWLSEVMLQQTQVATVCGYFNRFLEKFPTIFDLAKAPIDEVLALWSGLGYYARARHLHHCAQKIVEDFSGEFPDTVETLQQLPGIGPSTAGAICAQAFEKPCAILDGNVKRVFARLYAVSTPLESSATQKQLLQYAHLHMPKNRCCDYTQAIMDLGATVCKPRIPNCAICPWSKFCDAYKTQKVLKYPVRATRAAKPCRQAIFLWLENETQEVMLVRREASGIWGGLWCLPELTGNFEKEWSHWQRQKKFSSEFIQKLQYICQEYQVQIQVEKRDRDENQTCAQEENEACVVDKIQVVTRDENQACVQNKNQDVNQVKIQHQHQHHQHHQQQIQAHFSNQKLVFFPAVKHTFTHFYLEIRVLRICVSNLPKKSKIKSHLLSKKNVIQSNSFKSQRWLTLELSNLEQLGLPAPMKRLLREQILGATHG